MNNIFLPNDPLLYNSPGYAQTYEQKLQRDRAQLEQQYAEYMNNIKAQQVQNQIPDKLTELNNKINSIDPEVKQQLSDNSDFVLLNKTLQDTVQAELVNLIKNKINENKDMLDNIAKQMEIIQSVETNLKEKDRKNMSEINDYLENYSHMTFDEYKKLKNVKI